MLLLLLLVVLAWYGWPVFFTRDEEPGPPREIKAWTAVLPPPAAVSSVAAEPRVPLDASEASTGLIRDEEITIVIPAELLKEPFREKDLAIVIRWGDTLWDIADRYTGNPWNYRRIARENNIRNPNLIFPRQTLNIRTRP